MSLGFGRISLDFLGWNQGISTWVETRIHNDMSFPLF